MTYSLFTSIFLGPDKMINLFLTIGHLPTVVVGPPVEAAVVGAVVVGTVVAPNIQMLKYVYILLIL